MLGHNVIKLSQNSRDSLGVLYSKTRQVVTKQLYSLAASNGDREFTSTTLRPGREASLLLM